LGHVDRELKDARLVNDVLKGAATHEVSLFVT
jgi:hypothetical protein